MDSLLLSLLLNIEGRYFSHYFVEKIRKKTLKPPVPDETCLRVFFVVNISPWWKIFVDLTSLVNTRNVHWRIVYSSKIFGLQWKDSNTPKDIRNYQNQPRCVLGNPHGQKGSSNLCGRLWFSAVVGEALSVCNCRVWGGFLKFKERLSALQD